MRHFVIAKMYDYENTKITLEIVGEFKEFQMAKLFKDAYNDKYHADAKIVDEDELVNA